MLPARENPLRTERVLSVRFKPRGETWEQLMARLQKLGRRGLIVGPHGSGKTTLLEDAGERLEEEGIPTRIVYVEQRPVEDRERMITEALAALRPEEVFLVDGLDGLRAGLRRGVLSESKKAAGLIATSHRKERLPEWVSCRTSSALLAEILAELLPGREVEDVASELFRKHEGNLREAIRELYDRLAES